MACNEKIATNKGDRGIFGGTYHIGKKGKIYKLNLFVVQFIGKTHVKISWEFFELPNK